LGVTMFFALSGFLITSLLLVELEATGRIDLRRFWARRARRLVPAVLVLVAVVLLYVHFSSTRRSVGLLGDAVASLTWVANWRFVFSHRSYAALFSSPSPFQHMWSLAIEEQFYLVWPLVVLGVLWLAGRRSASPARGPLKLLLALSVVGLVASAIDMGLLFDGGKNLNRIYYGTDTRAFGLLIGAALAVALALARERTVVRARPPRLAFGLAALIALAVTFTAMELVNGSTPWLYPYGMLGLDAAVVFLIVAVVARPGCVAARLLAVGPLQALGKISYGVYLWHFPLFLWLSESATGLDGVSLLVLRVAVTLAVSTASYVLIEQPIRQRRRPAWLIRALTPLAAGGSVAALLLASAASALPVGVPAAASLPQPPPGLVGSDAGCTVTLTDGRGYGVAPPPKSKEARFVYNALGYHQLSWSGSAQKTFHTCPPKRVLLVGDSLAFTLGVPWLEDEERYGIKLADAGVLGCAFTTEGELNVAGTWEAQSAGCPNALDQWAAEKKAIHAQAVVVELGYRDQFDWKINGKVVHLGQPAFDKYLQSQIDHLVDVLGAGGTKILFLSVPYTHPPDSPDGSPSPAADPQRHERINSMIEAAAQRHPKSISVLDLDKTVSPGNHFDADINGQRCRFDGVHFSAYCSELVEPRVLGEVRKLLG
ncbi:MAG TPA: acyltransferase family protein, partial [Solirubrobacteraceae bacterium]|nr:acyltransferase family protein [Solirubrobacteraceae bacterium]